MAARAVRFQPLKIPIVGAKGGVVAETDEQGLVAGCETAGREAPI
jgi:hypothetical protein